MDNSNSIMETDVTVKRKGIYGSTLKLIAIFTMLIDHTAATILDKLLAKKMQGLDTNDLQAVLDFYNENKVLYTTDMVMRLIGRIAFPIFCFLLVEGFIHTRNKKKYMLRLALFALISEIPFDLAFYNKVLEFTHQNVFFTLLIAFSVMMGFQFISEKASDKKWLPLLAVTGAILTGCAVTYYIYGTLQSVNVATTQLTGKEAGDMNTSVIIFAACFLIAVTLVIYYIRIKRTSLQTASVRFADLAVLIIGMAVAQVLNTDYSAFGVLTIAVMYGLRRNRIKSMLGGCITLTIMSMFEFTAFFALIPIYLYNGKRGLKLKFVFYAFYPVHILLLYFICYFMGIA